MRWIASSIRRHEWKRKRNRNAKRFVRFVRVISIVRVNLILPMIPYNYAHHWMPSTAIRQQLQKQFMCRPFRHRRPQAVCVCVCFWVFRIESNTPAADQTRLARRAFHCLYSVTTTCFIAESILAHNQYGTRKLQRAMWLLRLAECVCCVFT